MVTGQRKFLEGVETLTSYGAYMRNKNYSNLLVDLNILENIINDGKA